MSKFWVLLLLPIALGVFIGGAYGFYYRGIYSPPDTPEIAFERIILPTPVTQGFAEALPRREGVFLLDKAHLNGFDERDVNRLLTRISETGYRIDTLEQAFSQGQLLAQMDGKLRGADVFAVIVPAGGYTEDEVDLVKEFVDEGGRLLLVADPTSRHEINSLSETFGMVFRDDFLYNVAEHDGIYRNMLLRIRVPLRANIRETLPSLRLV